MSKLYLRTTTANTSGYVRTEKSTTMPIGVFTDDGGGAWDLGAAAGSSEFDVLAVGSATTSEQSIFYGKFISALLTVGAVDANTWTIAWAELESAAQANAFLRVSVYVLTSGDTVRGFVYDASADLGVEYHAVETGQVATFSGSAVSGVISTDRLCLEMWCRATQTMATGYEKNIYINGTTDPTNLTTTSDAASYLSTPQDLFAVTATSLLWQPARPTRYSL